MRWRRSGIKIVFGVNKVKTIAIITARGGSKRIPRKNIKDFCGKPIIAYSIEAALKSNIFDEVMVSTDSEEIAGIARKYGANVPFLRSEATSNDYATTVDVLKEVLHSYENRYDAFCCIYPTAPFITADKLKKTYEKMIETGADSVVPVVKFSFPPQRGMIVRNGKLAYKEPAYALMRSQDLETVYHDCGQYYFCRTSAFMRFGSVFTDNTVPIEMPETEVQDIDNQSDWDLAELKYGRMIREDQ